MYVHIAKIHSSSFLRDEILYSIYGDLSRERSKKEAVAAATEAAANDGGERCAQKDAGEAGPPITKSASKPDPTSAFLVSFQRAQ